MCQQVARLKWGIMYTKATLTKKEFETLKQEWVSQHNDLLQAKKVLEAAQSAFDNVKGGSPLEYVHQKRRAAAQLQEAQTKEQKIRGYLERTFNDEVLEQWALIEEE
jgi:hypothetical protein